MDLVRGLYVKGFEDHREHFIARAKERYGITLNNDEYDECCRNFQGIYKKSTDKTIGYTKLDGITIWCLFRNDNKSLPTCYGENIINNPLELIKACFNISVRPIAYYIYECYCKERDSLRFDYETDKDAAIYYFNNTIFAPLHIDKFKYGSPRPFKIMAVIKNIIEGESRYAEFKLIKKSPSIRQYIVNGTIVGEVISNPPPSNGE